MSFFSLNIQPKKIYITESQLALLIEKVASIDEIYNTYYNTIPREDFNKIISSDPTYNQQKPNKMGKYSKWLLKLYGTNNLKLEDLYKATEYLSVFDKYSRRIEVNDINRYKNLPQLYNVIKPFIEDDNQATSKQDELRRIKQQGAEIVFNSPEWEIIIPKTWEASKLYGANTQWCTASRDDDSYFKHYTESGPLYINIDKRNNTKYQFHFESESFMDESDYAIETPIASTIDMPNDALEYYKSLGEDKYYALTFPPVGSIEIENEDWHEVGDDKVLLVPNENKEFALFFGTTIQTPYTYKGSSPYNRYFGDNRFLFLETLNDGIHIYTCDGEKFYFFDKDIERYIYLPDIVDEYGDNVESPFVGLFYKNGEFELFDMKNEFSYIKSKKTRSLGLINSEYIQLYNNDGTIDIVSLYSDYEPTVVEDGVYPLEGNQSLKTEINQETNSTIIRFVKNNQISYIEIE